MVYEQRSGSQVGVANVACHIVLDLATDTALGYIERRAKVTKVDLV
jgi:hypothetical protein